MNTSFVPGQKVFAKLERCWEPGEILDIYQTQDHSQPKDGAPPCYCNQQPNEKCDPGRTGTCHGQTTTWHTIRLDKDNFTYDTDAGLLRAEMPSYGTCQKCGRGISTPGLDSHYCDRCGWVPDSQWAIAQAATTRGKKSKGGAR